jgi:deoxyribonuclease-4
MKRLFGAHVSVAGGLEKAIENAKILGITAAQIHPSPPQRWNRNPYKAGYESAFLEARGDYPELEKIFFHSIYLINLATPDGGKIELAIKSLKYYLELCARAGGDGVIFHVGSLKDEPDETLGLTRAAEAIDEVLADTPENSRLLLEVSAGGGQIIGSKFNQLKIVYDKVKDGGGKKDKRLGFALDTQHMWASGYDLKDNLEGVISELDNHFGFNNIYAIHLNDSMTELASKKDRHANLGQGLIGEDALKNFIFAPQIAHIPVILETPALKSMDTARAEVDVLRGWLGND